MHKSYRRQKRSWAGKKNCENGNHKTRENEGEKKKKTGENEQKKKKKKRIDSISPCTFFRRTENRH